MSRPISYALRALALSIGLAIGSGTCLAAGNLTPPSTTNTGEEQQSESWYREQAAKPDAKAVAQQKAMVRADQRMARMASMQWYGMSNSRPQASGTPFSTRYSPLWEMPGGRPYAWYPQSRPGYVMYWR
jgi:hypothetical protein